jgi:hypothetical protein
MFVHFICCAAKHWAALLLISCCQQAVKHSAAVLAAHHPRPVEIQDPCCPCLLQMQLLYHTPQLLLLTVTTFQGSTGTP